MATPPPKGQVKRCLKGASPATASGSTVTPEAKRLLCMSETSSAISVDSSHADGAAAAGVQNTQLDDDSHRCKGGGCEKVQDNYIYIILIYNIYIVYICGVIYFNIMLYIYI